MTQYFTTTDALFFHKILIEHYSSATGIRDAGALESAIHRPQTGYYDTIVQEAAALLESLVQNHPFVDGNKRVAFAVVDVFLRVNAHALNADSQAIHDSLLEFLNNGTSGIQQTRCLKPEGLHVLGRRSDVACGPSIDARLSQDRHDTTVQCLVQATRRVSLLSLQTFTEDSRTRVNLPCPRASNSLATRQGGDADDPQDAEGLDEPPRLHI